MRILLIHQSSELYGSDRSFLSAVDALIGKFQSSEITVLLPTDGPLADQIRLRKVDLIFNRNGFIRKILLKNPLRFIWESISVIPFYVRLIARADCIYVNTVVCIVPILCLGFFWRTKKFIHVREIPTGFALVVFRRLLSFSKARLIFNSCATKNAFGLEGRVIYNGVERSTSKFSASFSESLNFNKLLVIGRLSHWKGQDFFLHALRSIAPRLSVRIVGSPAFGNESFLTSLQAAAKALNHDVSFFGFEEDPAHHFDWCDYVVVPSIDPEPFGRVAIEGFSFKKPVIAAAHGGLIEIVNAGRNGFLFSPANSASLREAILGAIAVEGRYYDILADNALSDFNSNYSLEMYQRNIRDIVCD